MSKIISVLAIVIYFFILFPTSISAKEIRPILRFEAKIDKQFNNDSYRNRFGDVTAIITIVNSDLEFKKWASSDSTLSRSMVFPLEVQVPGQVNPCGNWEGCVKYGDILLSVTVPEDFQVSRTNPIIFNVTLERKGGAEGIWQLTNSPAITNRVAQIGDTPARVEVYVGQYSNLVAEPNIPVAYTWTPNKINYSSPAIELDPNILVKKTGENFTLKALIDLGTIQADKYKGCYVNAETNQSFLCSEGTNTITFHIENNTLIPDTKRGIFSRVESSSLSGSVATIFYTTESSGFGTYLFCMYLWDPLKNDFVSGGSDITNCKPLVIREKLDSIIDDVQPSLDPNSVDLQDIVNGQAKITLSLAKHNRDKFLIKATSSVASLVTRDFTFSGIPMDCSKALLDTPCQKEMQVQSSFDTMNPALLETANLNPNEIVIKDESGKLRGTVNLTITDNNNKLAQLKADINKNLNPTTVTSQDKCKDKDSPDYSENCSKAGGEPCDSNTGFKTAIGCIHTTPAGFVKDFLTFAVGIGGGLAFIMMLFGAFQMMTSGGNPQNLQGGKDTLQNAIIGLLFIIFSILIMRIIGIDILAIPGFTP